MHLVLVLNWDERGIECWINIFVQGWRRMAQLTQDRPSINVVQHIIVVVGLIRESLIVEKDVIGMLSAFWLGCNANRQ